MSWWKSWIRDLRRVLQPAATQPSPIRVLAIMLKDLDALALARIAGRAGWELEFQPSCEYARDALKRKQFAVILLDRDLGGGYHWQKPFEQLSQSNPESSLILASRGNDDHLWQEVIRLGGEDVITKPYEEERVTRSIQFAWKSRVR